MVQLHAQLWAIRGSSQLKVLDCLIGDVYSTSEKAAIYESDILQCRQLLTPKPTHHFVLEHMGSDVSQQGVGQYVDRPLFT